MRSKDNGMGAGRPTKYNNQTVDKARHYLDNYQEYGDVVPQIAGLAVALGIHRDTLYEWAKDPEKRQFSDILKDVEIAQHKALVNGGLTGEFTSPIAKMMLTKHGYSDKQEIKQETTVTAEVKQITHEMPADEATRIYQDMINGKS